MNITRSCHHCLALALLATLATAPNLAGAAERTPAAILDDFARAVGGDKGMGKHRTLFMSRKLVIKGMGLEGSMDIWSTADGKFLSVMTLPGMGEMRLGASGKQRWSLDPINGLRILQGPEAEQARLDSTWKGELQLKKLYPKQKPVPVPAAAEKSKEKGQNLECLEMIPAKVKPVVMCFDTQTHLRVYQEGRQSSPQGEMPYSIFLSDWREVEGWKFAYLETTAVGPMTLESRVQAIKVGEKIPPATFRMPKPGDKPQPAPAQSAPPQSAPRVPSPAPQPSQPSPSATPNAAPAAKP